MNRASAVLRWLHLIAAAFTVHCTTTTARAGDPWYTLGLAAVTVLLVTAAVREYLAADERRAAEVRAQRAARLRDRTEQASIRQAAEALGHACCERWWTSCGFHHSNTCKNQRRTV